MRAFRDRKAALSSRDRFAARLFDRFHHRPAEELYRVDSDPWELNNLAADPEFAEAKRRLREELELWMDEQEDTGAAMDDPKAYAANRDAGRKSPR